VVSADPHYGSLPVKLSESAGGAEWLEPTGGRSVNSIGTLSRGRAVTEAKSRIRDGCVELTPEKERRKEIMPDIQRV
jgi:hypothetical protein